MVDPRPRQGNRYHLRFRRRRRILRRIATVDARGLINPRLINHLLIIPRHNQPMPETVAPTTSELPQITPNHRFHGAGSPTPDVIENPLAVRPASPIHVVAAIRSIPPTDGNLLPITVTQDDLQNIEGLVNANRDAAVILPLSSSRAASPTYSPDLLNTLLPLDPLEFPDPDDLTLLDLDPNSFLNQNGSPQILSEAFSYLMELGEENANIDATPGE